VYVTDTATARESVRGISAEFAMTKMDDDIHPEADVYVEDSQAQRLVTEMLARKSPTLARRVLVVPAGSASVLQSLGQMVDGDKFPRPAAAILDGDQSPAVGCIVLPGGDAPERLVLGQLREKGFPGVPAALSRSHTAVTDAVEAAVTLPDHHDWIPSICDKILIGRGEFWGACVREWLASCLPDAEQQAFVQLIADTLELP
jgi:hypothetical protein